MNDLCNYCGVQPIAPQWLYTCLNCVYTCDTCCNITPYESGSSNDGDCDGCWAKKQQQQEEIKLGNKKIMSVVVFDEATRSYTVSGTTLATDVQPEELLTLVTPSEDSFDKTITGIIDYEIQEIVSLMNSQTRARETRMTRADHRPIVMRTGEWQSILYALQLLEQDGSSVSPRYRVQFGVNFSDLIDIIRANVNVQPIMDKVVL